MARRLRCPSCRQTLTAAGAAHTCSGCGASYGAVDGIPLLLVPDALPMVRAEREYWDQRFAQQVSAADLQRFYGAPDFADDAWGWHRYHRRIAAAVAPGATVLEVGAGVGAQAIALALHRGFAAVVTDVSASGLALNRQAADAIGGGAIEYYAAEADRLPFDDGEFDVVLLHAALHHLPAPRAALGEMVRCLRPGGLLVLGYEPNRLVFAPLRRLAAWLRLTEKHSQRFVADRYSVADDETPGFTARELRTWTEERGLVVEWLEPVWCAGAVLYHVPVLAALLFGRQIEIAPGLRRAARWLDERVIARLPLVRQLSLAWSLGARRPRGLSPASSPSTGED